MMQEIATPYRPYLAYKDSNVNWLGEIPAHWKITKVKFGYDVQLGKMLQPEPSSPHDSLHPYLRSANVYWNGVDLTELKEMWFSPHDEKQFSLKQGDLIVCEGGDVGRAAIWESSLECFIQNAVHRVRPKAGYDNKYLYYWLYALKQNGYIDLLCNKATIAHFTEVKLENLELAAPSLGEQCFIVNFLDRETAHIDELIAAKQRLIELLHERRSALITRMVTKGLNSNVPMKDSGLEWLGEIPAHWKVMRLAMAAKKITNGYVGPTRDIYVENDPAGVRYLQSLHIKNGTITFEEHEKQYYVSAQWSHEHPKSILEEGDVLIVQTGAIGECAIVTKKFAGANCHALIIVQLKNKYGNGAYLSALLRSDYGKNALLSSMTGALHPHLECGKVREIPIVLPPPDEQELIIHTLNHATDEFDSYISRVDLSIRHLQEYRSALISAAVTGKIDVREMP